MSELPKVRLKSDNLKLPPSWLTDALAVASAVMPAAFAIPAKSGDAK